MEHRLDKWDFDMNGQGRIHCACKWYTSMQPTAYAIKQFGTHIDQQENND